MNNLFEVNKEKLFEFISEINKNQDGISLVVDYDDLRNLLGTFSNIQRSEEFCIELHKFLNNKINKNNVEQN